MIFKKEKAHLLWPPPEGCLFSSSALTIAWMPEAGRLLAAVPHSSRFEWRLRQFLSGLQLRGRQQAWLSGEVLPPGVGVPHFLFSLSLLLFLPFEVSLTHCFCYIHFVGGEDFSGLSLWTYLMRRRRSKGGPAGPGTPATRCDASAAASRLHV